MDKLVRALIAVVVFIVTFYFVFWVPLSFIPGMHKLVLLRIILSFSSASIAAWCVWRGSLFKDAGRAHYMIYGAFVTGIIAFSVGFFGPLIFMPEANLGPLLGIFITGPLGLLAGGIGGYIYWLKKIRSTN